jgi:hypothetical protein
MNIEVGMKCKQVKVIEEYGFDFVGREFNITKTDDKVVMGMSGCVGFGIEKDKFFDYFELVVKSIADYSTEDLLNEIINRDDVLEFQTINRDDCKVITLIIEE